MTRRSPLVGLAAVLGLALSAAAQMSSDAPEVGDPLPDVAGYDADGQPFALTRLKGKHAVIVFGCLT